MGLILYLSQGSGKALVCVFIAWSGSVAILECYCLLSPCPDHD